MFCPHCGKEAAQGHQYCPFCGNALQEPTSTVHPSDDPNGPVASPAQARPMAARALWRFFFWGVVAVGVIFIAAFVFTRLKMGPPGSQADQLARQMATMPVPPSQPRLVPVQQSVPIAQGNVVVAAGQIQYFRFTVPEVAQGTKVTGQFHAFGGAGNDIEAGIMTPFEFENWSNGHQARVYYDSGQATNGEIEVDGLPAGTYILAFSNRTSVFSRKEVTAQVTLNYTVLERR
jgi:hypothetical protein